MTLGFDPFANRLMFDPSSGTLEVSGSYVAKVRACEVHENGELRGFRGLGAVVGPEIFAQIKRWSASGKKLVVEYLLDREHPQEGGADA